MTKSGKHCGTRINCWHDKYIQICGGIAHDEHFLFYPHNVFKSYLLQMHEKAWWPRINQLKLAKFTLSHLQTLSDVGQQTTIENLVSKFDHNEHFFLWHKVYETTVIDCLVYYTGFNNLFSYITAFPG